ncbi:MAG: decaprenyl-phosphate phosphoribosyltransferase [Alphaproteobacteria bacterium]
MALLRPHQWVKNLFIAAPLFFTPEAVSAASVSTVALGVAAFSLLASGIYILNDWADRKADALHPEKRHRPLAAGAVPVALAALLMVLLLAGGLAGAWLLDTEFFGIALVYAGVNAAYSLGLKRLAIVDVLMIAFGFVLRIEAGAALIGVSSSPWIVITAGLLALFLALAKRRDDFVRNLDAGHRPSLSGYSRTFLDAALAMTLGAMLVAYLIYTTDQNVMARMGTEKLYYTAPFVVAGVLRYLQITLVDERSGSPTRIVLSDRFMLMAVLGWIAVFAGLIYL